MNEILPQNEITILPGKSHPLGATVFSEGVNFSLFSKNGLSAEILLFNHTEDLLPFHTIKLHPEKNRTYHYWHAYIPGLKTGQLYAYRIYGPADTGNGHRFDPDCALIDPYSKAVAFPVSYRRADHISGKDNKGPSLKSVVVDTSGYDWEGDIPIRRPFNQTIIYEMHVAGFTKHPNSGVQENKRGTYSGVIEKIPYLVDLGITAVELLPVFQFDPQDSPEGKINYWGYSPISFFAPHHGYGTTPDPQKTLNEFRDMVKAFHKAGIEVILDVVYNHTAEGNEDGPTLCYRGIDNSIYYILEENKAHYANYSGTGNTLNANQAIVRRMIIDSLHFWVTEMHIDGFRFDLASILSRDENGNCLKTPPVLWDIETDPVLAGVKLIAEAWDAAGLYQVGSFTGDNWKEWNGRFRDDIRSFIRGDAGKLSGLVTRMVGSPDIYGGREREPEQSINFVTCHDGFTLNDLVSYNSKHNEANGENNRDGNNDNISWNCGVEGPANDPSIETLRNRQIRNFLCMTLLSIGAPMILMGDEVRRTQKGNNNAYCQDNDISWFDWSLPEIHTDILRFVKQLVSLRLNRDASQAEHQMSLNELLGRNLITWHGTQPGKPDWSESSKSIAFAAESITGRIQTLYIINAFHEKLEFELPFIKEFGSWKRLMDTSLPSPEDFCSWLSAKTVDTKSYLVQPYSQVILVTSLNEHD